MPHAVLFVQRRDRLSASNLAARRGHVTIRNVWVTRSDNMLNHRAAKIALADDAIRLESPIRSNGGSAPDCRARLYGFIGQDIAQAIQADASNNNADSVTRIIARCSRRIDRNHDAFEIRDRVRVTRAVEHFASP